jgi:hypothetical protein
VPEIPGKLQKPQTGAQEVCPRHTLKMKPRKIRLERAHLAKHTNPQSYVKIAGNYEVGAILPRNNKKTPSAQGEANARLGLGAQDRVAAADTLKALWDPKFEQLRLVDPQAGPTDDYVLVFSDRVVGNSVKWSRQATDITWSEFLQWLCDLSAGWLALERQYPDRAVCVYLRTNRNFSRAQHGNQTFPEQSVYDFASEFSGQASIFSGEVWDCIREKTSLADSRLENFARSCSFDTGMDLPKPQPGTGKERDLEGLRRFIEARIFAQKGSLTVLELKQFLGTPRPLNQEYPKPEFHFIESATEAELLSTLHRNDRGYIALLGLAGSGKSSLVSRVLENREQTIPYYVYLPGDVHNPAGRGEPLAFFNSVISYLDHQLPGSRDSLSLKSVDESVQALKGLLRAAEQAYDKTNKVTTIVIDGLDHIERTPLKESFLARLPEPLAIPRGCLVVLSTRPSGLQLLPPEIQSHLQGPRTITIAPLAPDAIQEKISAYTWLEKDQALAVSHLCNGSPLILTHLLRACQLDPNLKLRDVQNFTGIDDYYEATLGNVMDEVGLNKFLGLLSRVETPCIDWLIKWDCFGSSTFDFTYKKYLSAFFRNDLGRISPIHVSLGDFLRKRTLPQTPGADLQAAERALHLELARLSQQLSDELRDETRLRHLFLAGDYSSVVAQVNREWFEDARERFRPPSEIGAACQLAINAALMLRDPATLLRLLPLAYDIGSREHTVSSTDLADFFLISGELRLAISYLCDNWKLRVEPNEALDFAKKLLAEPRAADSETRFWANKLFELARPRRMLAGLDKISDHDIGLVTKWFELAPNFISIIDLENILKRLQFRQSHSGFPLQGRVQLAVLDGLLSCNLDEAHTFTEQLLGNDCVDLKLRVLKRKEACFQTDELPGFTSCVPALLVQRDPDKSATIWLARQLVDRGKEIEARQLTDSIKLTDLFTENLWGHLDNSLDYLCLLHSLGLTNTPQTWKQSFDEVDARLLQALQNLASLEAHAEGTLGKAELTSAFEGILRYKTQKIATDVLGHSKYRLRNSSRSIHNYCLRAAKKHGSVGLSALAKAYSSLRLNTTVFSSYFASEMAYNLWLEQAVPRSQVLLELQSCTDRLSLLEPKERAEEILRLAALYVSMGERKSAEKLRSQLPVCLSVVGEEKDPQMLHWMDWISSGLSMWPTYSAQNARWVEGTLSTVATALEQVGGSHGVEAAESLMQKAFKYLPEDLCDLGFSMIERGRFGFSFENLLEALTEAISEVDPLLASELFKGFVARLSTHPSLTGGSVLRSLHRLGEDATHNTLLQSVITDGCRSDLSDEVRNLTNTLTRLGAEVPQDILRLQSALSKRDRDTDNYVTVSGQSFSPAELASILSNLTVDLDVEALASAENKSYYRWNETLRQIKTVTPKRLRELEILVEKNRHKCSELVALAELADRSQLESQAVRLAESALSVSDPLGWYEAWDGGSKRKLFSVLIRLKGEDQREVAISEFIGDVSNKLSGTDFLLFSLRELIELFGWVWPEVEATQAALEYLKDKLKPIEAKEDFVFKSSRQPSSQTWQRAVVATLVRLIDAPFPVLACPAIDCLAWILENRHDQNFREAWVSALGSEHPVRQEILLTILLEFFNRGRLKSSSDFKLIIQQLYRTSCDFAVTRISAKLCKAAGWSCQRLPKPMPAIYRLAVKTTAVPTDLNLRAHELAEAPLGITLEIFSAWFSALADHTQIDETTLRYRAQTIYADTKSKFFWAQDCEKFEEKWKAALSSDESFVRPQYRVARHSMMVMTQELVDAGAIEETEVPAAEHLRQVLDPLFIGLKPSFKPRNIQVPQERANARDQSWLIQPSGEAVLSSCCREVEGRTVLGEATLIRSNFFSRETENRSWGLTSGPGRAGIRFIGELSSAYYLRGLSQRHIGPELLVARGSSPLFRSTLGWMALCPTFAHKFGWELSNSGLFRYCDSSGDIMVESLWWREGWCHRRQPIQDGFASEGWLVVASPAALHQLIGEFVNLQGVGALCRSAYDSERNETLNAKWPIKFEL